MIIDDLSTARRVSTRIAPGLSRPRATRGIAGVWRTEPVRRYGPIVLLVAVIAVIYHGWLAGGIISYGDWNFQPSARLRDFWPVPSLWEGAYDTGSANILAGPMFPVHLVEGFLNQLHLDPTLIERVVWIFPGVLIGSLATYALAVTFFRSRLAGILSGLLAVTNAYIALVMTGGQFTVSTGYMLTPLVLLLFYRALLRPVPSRLALTALCLAIQVMFDLRSTYLTLGVLFLFALHYTLAQRSWRRVARVLARVGLQFVVTGVVAILVHLFWLLPGRYAEKITLPAGYDSTGWVHTLSYMQLSHAFALMHPFWYQDTFSPQVTPVNPVFLLLPLPIFAVFLRKRLTFVELFLFSTAVLAIFLVKGYNPPAGEFYDWLFTHLTGFSMFRDPSKFYQPLGLAYALLLGRAAALLSSKGLAGPKGLNLMVRAAAPVACAGLVLLQALPVAANTRWGTLAPQSVAREYVAYNDYIDRQPQFFRIMWFLSFYPYATYSSLHPNVGSNAIGPAQSWRASEVEAMLRALSVKYLVVADYPDATSDYKANEAGTIALLRHTFPHFPEIRIGGIHLFVNRAYLPAAFVSDAAIAPSTARMLRQRAVAPPLDRLIGTLGEYADPCHSCATIVASSPTRYDITVTNMKRPFLLVLNQGFDPNWAAYVEPSSTPQPFWWTWRRPAVAHRDHMTVNGFANAWLINAPGTHHIVVEYWPQRLTDVGWIVCWLTIAGCLATALVPLVLKQKCLWAGHGATARMTAQAYGRCESRGK